MARVACEKGVSMETKRQATGQGTGASGSSTSLAGASSEELMLLSQLLQLLRSGSSELKGLLGASTGSSQPSPAQKAPAPLKKDKEQPATDWVQAPSRFKVPAKPENKQEVTPVEVLTSCNANAVGSIKELTTDKACFCMASMADARKAISELSSDKPMAILVPGPVDGTGRQVPVVVRKEGKECSWTRWLVQLGKQDVAFDYSGVTAGGRVGATNTKVVVFGRQVKCPADVWASLQQNPKAAVDMWLKKTVGLTEVGRLYAPMLVNEELSVVAEIPPGGVARVELASGENGLFSRRFVESPEDRAKQRVVPLEAQHDRLAAMRIAKSKGALSLGVVPTKRGWGIRVLAENFQTALADVNPTAQADFLGEEYVVSSLPLSWGSANVAEFLGQWAAKPVGRPRRVGFTNTWSVRVEQPPPASTLRNGDPLGLNVIGVVSKKEYRPKPNQVVLRMRPGPTSKNTQMPRSWAETVKIPAATNPAMRQRPAQQVRSASPAEAPSAPTLPNGSAPPADFMAQLQAMIVAAVKPLQEEIAAIKEVVDQDMQDEAEAEASEEEVEEDAEDETMKEAKRFAEVPEPIGNPPKHARR